MVDQWQALQKSVIVIIERQTTTHNQK